MPTKVKCPMCGEDTSQLVRGLVRVRPGYEERTLDVRCTKCAIVFSHKSSIQSNKKDGGEE
jgi:uncharacterized Zn finger protein